MKETTRKEKQGKRIYESGRAGRGGAQPGRGAGKKCGEGKEKERKGAGLGKRNPMGRRAYDRVRS